MTTLKTAVFLSIAMMMTWAMAAKDVNAAVLFTLTEVGGDVLVSGSGSYDLTGATFGGAALQDGFLNSSNGLAVGGPFQAVDTYTLTLNPGAFGTGVFFNGDPDVGDVFGFDSITGFLTVPAGYTSGSPLAGTTTFTGQNFASLGLTPGIFVYGIPNDTLTVEVVPSVPTLSGPWTLLAFLVFTALGAAVLSRNRPRWNV